MKNEDYERLKKEHEDLQSREEEILVKNMPKFERGVAEASLEREGKIWNDLREVFIKHEIVPQVNLRLASDIQDSGDPTRPGLVCGGVIATLTYRVMPVDEEGRTGSISQEEQEEVGEIRKRKQEIQDKLGG